MADLVAAPPGRDAHGVVPAPRSRRRRSTSAEHRPGDPAREPPGEQPGEQRADGDRDGEPPDERQPLVAQLGPRLRDDDRAERVALRLEPHRLGRREVGAAAARRRELERDRPLQRRVTSAGTDDSASRVRPESWPGKSEAPDVEDAVAGRELELRGGEVDRAGSLVGRAQGGVGVELREPRRLALQLLRPTGRACRSGRAAARSARRRRPRARSRAGRGPAGGNAATRARREV